MGFKLSDSTLDYLLEGFQLISFEWKYLYVNEAVVKQSRMSREDLIGHTMMEKYPGIEHTAMFRTLSRCMADRTSATIENHFTFPDGSRRWFELHVQAVPEGIFILSLDITERKESEAELLMLNERLEDIVALRTNELEGKNREITDSLKYAKNIQSAFLNTRSEIENNFEESFVIYKPKDIVSGDFYWCKKKDNTILLAAADCTGHGVPGALMSMIGIEKLNSAAVRSVEPGEILRRLNKGIKSALQADRNDSKSNDGMDIALCAITADKRKLRYAGANRPLWLMRNGRSEMEQIRPIKRSIGGNTSSAQEFIGHEVDLNKGDTLYLFSDGYADTFGGSASKKLTTRRFREMLTTIRPRRMEEQRQYLDSYIEEWRGGNEQTDDILVMGVRI
jgi:PAS domain S-box-containing protein